MIRRSLDIVVSLGGMIVFSPLFALIALLVKTGSHGRVIYSQERIGRNGRPFKIYKFRSMVEDAEKDGPQLSFDNDPRITPSGRLLRKYHLDELPQLWNVFIGDMSLIGPRPERRYFIEKVRQLHPVSPLLWKVRPGLTSWGMVCRGYASTVEGIAERMNYEMDYLSNRTLRFDLKVIAGTFKAVAEGRGK